MKGLGLNEQEQSVLAHYQFATEMIYGIRLIVEPFAGKKFWQYENFVNKYKKEGFIAIKPPYVFNNGTRYNDFSIYLPSKYQFPSTAIECKLRINNVPLCEISDAIYRRKNVPETQMYFIFEGTGFKNQSGIKNLMQGKNKVFFNLNHLPLS